MLALAPTVLIKAWWRALVCVKLMVGCKLLLAGDNWPDPHVAWLKNTS